jgi:hypothetical protein
MPDLAQTMTFRDLFKFNGNRHNSLIVNHCSGDLLTTDHNYDETVYLPNSDSSLVLARLGADPNASPARQLPKQQCSRERGSAPEQHPGLLLSFAGTCTVRQFHFSWGDLV